MSKLWSESLGGNLHEASHKINQPGFWVNWESVVAMQFASSLTVVVFQVSNEEYARLCEKYRRNP